VLDVGSRDVVEFLGDVRAAVLEGCEPLAIVVEPVVHQEDGR
jgi:hypothetical protein